MGGWVWGRDFGPFGRGGWDSCPDFEWRIWSKGVNVGRDPAGAGYLSLRTITQCRQDGGIERKLSGENPSVRWEGGERYFLGNRAGKDAPVGLGGLGGSVGAAKTKTKAVSRRHAAKRKRNNTQGGDKRCVRGRTSITKIGMVWGKL